VNSPLTLLYSKMSVVVAQKN